MTQETAIATVAPEKKFPTQADLDRIILNYERPTSSITIFDFQPFPFEQALKARKVIVEIMAKTKTRFYFGVRYGGKYESTYIKPAGSEHLKFFEQPMQNRNTGERFNYHLFAASKKQGIKAMENHVRCLILQLFDLYGTEENFNVTIWDGSDMRAFRSACE